MYRLGIVALLSIALMGQGSLIIRRAAAGGDATDILEHLWFEDGDCGTPCSSGEDVNTWTDVIGSYDLPRETIYAPTVALVNGEVTLDFIDGDVRMSNSISGDDWDNPTYYAYIEWQGTSDILAWGAESADGASELYFWWDNSATDYFAANAGTALKYNYSSPPSGADGVWVVQYNGTSSKIYRNCVEVASGDAGSESAASLRVGHYSGLGNKDFEGRIGHLGIDLGVSTLTEIKALTDYMCTLYGISAVDCGDQC